MEKVRERGSQDMQRSIAQKSLSTLDDATIGQITGLSPEEIRFLQGEALPTLRAKMG